MSDAKGMVTWNPDFSFSGVGVSIRITVVTATRKQNTGQDRTGVLGAVPRLGTTHKP